jgi:cell division protease FtsH
LQEWETIDADQINDIMAGKEPRPPKPTQSNKAPEPPTDPTETEAAATNQPAEGV